MERGQGPRGSSFSRVLTPTVCLGNLPSSRGLVHKVSVVTGLASFLTSLGSEAPGRDRGEFQVERSIVAFLIGWRQLSASGGTMAEMLGTALQSWGKWPRPWLIPVHLRAREVLWPHWGLKQAAVLCVPSWGAGQGQCHGNCPLLRRRDGRSGLSGPAWRLCSLQTVLGPHSPSSSHKSEPQVRAECAGGKGRGLVALVGVLG